MKKTIAALSISAVAFLGAGCEVATNDSNTNTDTPTTTQAPSSSPSKNSNVSAYVKAAREVFPSASEADLIEVGQLACDTIDDNGSITGALIAIIDDPAFYGLEYEAGYIMGAAIPVFCPEYKAELNRLTK